MTNHDALPPGIDHVDELLDVADMTPAEAEALHAFLAATAGPARPDELAGEAAAVSAFRAANRAPAAVPGRSWTRRLAAVFTVKAVVLTGMSIGGVALAATTGVLPTPLPAKAPKAEIVRPPADDRAGKASDQGARDAAERRDDSNPVRGELAEPARADAAFPGVCGALARRAEVSDVRGLARLVAAAGGRDKVAGFCAGLAADGSGAIGGSRDKSSGPGRSDDRGGSGQAGKSERSDKVDGDRDDRSGKSEQNDQADRSGNDEDGEKSEHDRDDRSGKDHGDGKSDAESDRPDSDGGDSDGGDPDGGDPDGGDASDDGSDRSDKSGKSGSGSGHARDN